MRILLTEMLIVSLAYAYLPLWGTYRPGVYFGVKARSPRSPSFGIMWYNAERTDSINRMLL